MKNKIIKIFSILGLVLMLSSFIGGDCNIVQNVLGDKKAEKLNQEDVKKATTAVANLLASIAGVVAVGFVIYGGIQYIGSAGNQEQANKAKQTITYAIIGLVLIICSYVIVKWFTDFMITGNAGF